MGNAISELIQFLEYSLQKEQDPEEIEELHRTLLTAKKVEEQHRKLCSA